MPPGCAYTFYLLLARLFYFGRDSCFYLCQWRDFFLAGATFFIWRDFFYLARLFLIWRDFFYLSGLFLFGATFFIWRDFFLAGATFFIWRDFFYLARPFLIWRDFFYLAPLFLFGATFFIWRVFYAGAWVRTLCIPYYSVINIVSNNPINPCLIDLLCTLVYLYIPSRENKVRERIPCSIIVF